MSLWASQNPLLATCDKQRLLYRDRTWGWDAAAEQSQGTVTLRLATHPTPRLGEGSTMAGIAGVPRGRKLCGSSCFPLGIPKTTNT